MSLNWQNKFISMVRALGRDLAGLGETLFKSRRSQTMSSIPFVPISDEGYRRSKKRRAVCLGVDNDIDDTVDCVVGTSRESSESPTSPGRHMSPGLTKNTGTPTST